MQGVGSRIIARMEPHRQGDGRGYHSYDNNDARSAGRNGANVFGCFKCEVVPAAPAKLRACAGCHSVKYCSEICQRENWSEHKLVCKSSATARDEVVSSLEQCAPGSAERNFKRDQVAVHKWVKDVPGLIEKLQFLALKHKSESPIVKVRAASVSVVSVDSVLKLMMLPRAQWDDHTRMVWMDADVAKQARYYFGGSNFRPDDTFVVDICIDVAPSGEPYAALCMRKYDAIMRDVHASTLSTLTAEQYAAEILRRRNDPAAVYVRLTGLQGAAHLNGQEAVLIVHDPNNSERFIVRLGGGREMSVRSQNYEMVQRPKLFTREF